MTEDQYFFECIVLKGECPDCSFWQLDIGLVSVQCPRCHSIFEQSGFHFRRVKPTQVMTSLKNGAIIKVS
jgi:hypothetical protein